MSVVATYVHCAPYYVPEQLPQNVLVAAAIEVDTERVEGMLRDSKLTSEDRAKVLAAYRAPAFKHVSVSVKKG
jgi:hypothetical protein